jgi:hypothetical protein
MSAYEVKSYKNISLPHNQDATEKYKVLTKKFKCVTLVETRGSSSLS